MRSLTLVAAVWLTALSMSDVYGNEWQSASTVASGRVDVASELLRGLEKGDLNAVGKFQFNHRQLLRNLPLNQRNAVALAAAKSLVVSNDLNALTVEGTKTIRMKRNRDCSEAEKQFLDDLAIASAAANILRQIVEHDHGELAVRERITESAVIPFLIEALKNPEIDRECYSVLRSLTFHVTGEPFFAGRIKDEAVRKQIVDWWQQWWEKTNNKHPIYTPNLQASAKAELEQAYAKIAGIAPLFREFDLFDPGAKPSENVPSGYGIPDAVLCYISYMPARDMRSNLRTMADPEFMLLCRCKFGTRDVMFEGDERERYRRAEDSGFDHRSKQTLYAKTLEGTDVVLEVSVVSKNQDLIRNLTDALNLRAESPPEKCEVCGAAFLQGSESEIDADTFNSFAKTFHHYGLHAHAEAYVINVEKAKLTGGPKNQVELEAIVLEQIKGERKPGTTISFKRVFDSHPKQVENWIKSAPNVVWYVLFDEDGTVDAQDPLALRALNDEVRGVIIKHKAHCLPLGNFKVGSASPSNMEIGLGERAPRERDAK